MIKNLLANGGDVRDAGLDMTEATWHVHMKGIQFENFEQLQRNQSCLIFATPWTVASQAPLSMEILQTKILEWVAVSSSRGSSQPRD